MAEQLDEKEFYLAVRMGLKVACANCRRPIHFPLEKGGARWSKWLHDLPGTMFHNRKACWNDIGDGVAVPMTENDMQDWHEAIENESE